MLRCAWRSASVRTKGSHPVASVAGCEPFEPVAVACPGRARGATLVRFTHLGPRADQDLRHVHRRRRHRSRRRARRGVRLSRPERRRQELHHAHDRLRCAHHVRPAEHPRYGSGHPRPADPRAARRRPAAGHPRPRTQRRRQPLRLRPVLRHVARRAAAEDRRAARVRPARRPRQGQGRAAVGRHEAAAHHRPLADQRSRRSCCWTSRRPASTRRPGTCCGTGSTGSSSPASRSC